MGFVYFLRSPSGRVKIGKSINPFKRCKDIDVFCETELLHTIESNNMHQLEREIHKKYESFQVDRECFKLPDTYLKEILTLTDNDFDIVPEDDLVVEASALLLPNIPDLDLILASEAPETPEKEASILWKPEGVLNMTDDQRQIVLGTLLGNGFICSAKNPYLCVQHSEDYLPYFRSKMFHLMEFGRKNAWYQKDTTWGWRSRCSPVWNEFRKLCYTDKKKTISMEWLDQLRAIGVAVWYGDSGCSTGYKKRNACLRTQSFGLEGNEIICRYFNEVGIHCNINKSKKSYVIVFTVAGTKLLHRLIGSCLSPSIIIN